MEELKTRRAKIEYILTRTSCFKGDTITTKEVSIWSDDKVDKCITLIKQMDAKKKQGRRRR